MKTAAAVSIAATEANIHLAAVLGIASSTYQAGTTASETAKVPAMRTIANHPRTAIPRAHARSDIHANGGAPKPNATSGEATSALDTADTAT